MIDNTILKMSNNRIRNKYDDDYIAVLTNISDVYYV